MTDLAEALTQAADRCDSTAMVSVLFDDVGLNRRVIANACGSSDRVVRNWANGATPRHWNFDSLVRLTRLTAELVSHLPADAVGRWLESPNPLLSGRRPLDTMQELPIETMDAARHLAVTHA